MTNKRATRDPRVFLQQELLDRRRLNPRYSERAMARDLGLSSPFFSQLMSGKKTLSEEKAVLVSKKLGWSGAKTKAFQLLNSLARARTPELRRLLSDELEHLGVSTVKRAGVRRVKLDAFQLMSEWYHSAIVELTELKEFRPEVEWIAKALVISRAQAADAIDRLVRLGLLTKELKKSDAIFQIGDIPSEAIRNYHRQLLSLADQALAEQDPSHRDFSSCTMAIDPDKIPEARKLIRNVQKDLMALLETGDRRAVYHVSMQLFRLDKIKK